MDATDRIRNLKSDALDFAPAILRAEHQPPSPLPRMVLYALLALFGAMLVWSVLGRLDIIAVAEGKVVPVSYLQIVQPSDAGIVAQLLVKDGDEVRGGQVLARLDTKLSDADLKQLKNDLAIRSLQVRRIDAELAGAPMQRRAADPPALFAQVEAQLRDRRQAYLDALASERALLEKAGHDLSAAREIESKLRKTVPIYREQEQAFDKLNKDGFAGRLMFLEKQRDRIEKEQDLRAQESSIASLKAAITQSETRIAQVTSNYRQQLQNERVDAEGQLHRLRQELEKESHKHELLELRAPQDGYVKDLATHTVGSVLAAGTVVMTIVPKNEPVQAEVWVANQDAGFVAPGQPVQLKLAAYPFQKYGMARGVVKQISPDSSDLPQAANLEKKRGDGQHVPPDTGYRTLVAFEMPYLQADGERHRVSAGMQLTAEINLGTRSILEYLLSPIQQTVQEAARER